MTTADLPSNNPNLGRANLHEILGHLELALSVEETKDLVEQEDIHLPFELFQGRLGIENVCLDEMWVEEGFVAEEIEAEIPKCRDNIRCVHVASRYPVSGEEAEILAKTASNVKYGGSVLKSIDNVGVPR